MQVKSLQWFRNVARYKQKFVFNMKANRYLALFRFILPKKVLNANCICKSEDLLPTFKNRLLKGSFKNQNVKSETAFAKVNLYLYTQKKFVKKKFQILMPISSRYISLEVMVFFIPFCST